MKSKGASLAGVARQVGSVVQNSSGLTRVGDVGMVKMMAKDLVSHAPSEGATYARLPIPFLNKRIFKYPDAVHKKVEQAGNMYKDRVPEPVKKQLRNLERLSDAAGGAQVAGIVTTAVLGQPKKTLGDHIKEDKKPKKPGNPNIPNLRGNTRINEDGKLKYESPGANSNFQPDGYYSNSYNGSNPVDVEAARKKASMVLDLREKEAMFGVVKQGISKASEGVKKLGKHLLTPKKMGPKMQKLDTTLNLGILGASGVGMVAGTSKSYKPPTVSQILNTGRSSKNASRVMLREAARKKASMVLDLREKEAVFEERKPIYNIVYRAAKKLGEHLSTPTHITPKHITPKKRTPKHITPKKRTPKQLGEHLSTPTHITPKTLRLDTGRSKKASRVMLREAKKDEIKHLYKKCLEYKDQFLLNEKTSCDLLWNRMHTQHTKIYGSKDHLISFVNYGKRPIPGRKPNAFHLRAVYVNPEYGGKGLGKEIILEVIESIKKEHDWKPKDGFWLKVSDNNDKMKKLVKKLGFTRIDTWKQEGHTIGIWLLNKEIKNEK